MAYALDSNIVESEFDRAITFTFGPLKKYEILYHPNNVLNTTSNIFKDGFEIE